MSGGQVASSSARTGEFCGAKRDGRAVCLPLRLPPTTARRLFSRSRSLPLPRTPSASSFAPPGVHSSTTQAPFGSPCSGAGPCVEARTSTRRLHKRDLSAQNRIETAPRQPRARPRFHTTLTPARHNVARGRQGGAFGHGHEARKALTGSRELAAPLCACAAPPPSPNAQPSPFHPPPPRSSPPRCTSAASWPSSRPSCARTSSWP
jgi:hypothetical protein